MSQPANESVPWHAKPLLDGGETTPWEEARERLANPGPDEYSHAWLATVRPDGRPHLMPLISFWIDGSLHFIVGEGTRKARNLAANAWCVVGTENRKIPSLDVVVEGRAEPLSDPDDVRRVAEAFSSQNWPLEARGTEVYGPNAPTAGPAPYRIYRLTPHRAFGLPGNYGMFRVEPDALPKATRWDFSTG
jgi:hypothetical protein